MARIIGRCRILASVSFDVCRGASATPPFPFSTRQKAATGRPAMRQIDTWTSATTTSDLDWPRVLAGLASHARSALGKEACLALPFLHQEAEISASFEDVDEALALHRLNQWPHLSDIYDIEQELRAAERGAAVPGLGLLNVAHLMRSMIELRTYAQTVSRAAPRFWKRISLLTDLSSIAADIERSIDERGEITNDASAALGRMRAQALSIHDEVVRDLDKLVVELAEHHIVAERFVTLRNDRFVIPVKASEQNRVPGILHDSSQTGYTVFIEPEIAVERGNKLKFLHSRIEEEERRILRELSAAIANVARELRLGLKELIAADVWLAKGLFAIALRAERPMLVRGTERIELKKARHPLLVMMGATVVPNDLTFGSAPDGTAEQCLVLTGPNTGGKTAALKTLALCTLMSRAGLFVPASDSSRIPMFGGVHSVIGDNQSIERSLSTFGNHIKETQHVLAMCQTTAAPCLVLLDEICADTDPRLGAALARAVLEALVQARATVVVTTHYSELATLATQDHRFATAAFGFDFTALRPTYRLERGALGASNPLEIAAQLGLDQAIIHRARTYTSPEVERESSMRAELERLQKEVLALREQAQRDKQAAMEDRREAERIRASAAAERDKAVKEAHQILSTDLQKAQEQVRQAVRKLQQGVSSATQSGDTAQAMRLANEVRETLAEEAKQLPEPEQNEPATERSHFRVGQQVLARGLMGTTPGEIVAIDHARGEATVSLGALRVRQSLDALRPARGTKPARPETQSSVRPGKYKPQPVEQAEPAASLVRADGRVDLRGGRVDEALRELDRALDLAIKEQRARLTIVHGHGTGALKSAVREYLSFSHYVRSYRPGDDAEGRDGVTVVEL